MSRLHDTLIEQYAEHYQRVNAYVISEMPPVKYFKGMQLMYGDLISQVPHNGKVLDLGCGTGFLLSWLAAQKNIVPVGIDSSGSQVEIARSRLPTLEIICDDGLHYLHQNPDTFAGIFCTDVLEHIPGEDLCLTWVEAAWAALRPGGFFFCRVPNAANLTGTYSRYIDLTHQRSFTSPSLLQLLQAGGLQNCRIVPIREGHYSGKIRLMAESVLHRVIFRICGRDLERVFTSNVCAVGFRK